MYLNQNKSEFSDILAETIVIDLINLLKGNNIELTKVYFKQKNPKYFEYLLIVNNDYLLMDNYSVIYESAHLIKRRYLNEGLNADFSFLGDKGLVAESVFTSEGWIIGSYFNDVKV